MDYIAFNAPGSPGVNQWRNDILYAAEQGKIPSCLLAAIVAEETGGINEFQRGMPLGAGCGVGLAQITQNVEWHPNSMNDPTFAGGQYHLMKPGDNLYVAAAFFLQGAVKDALLLQLRSPARFTMWGGGQVVYYAAAAYNAGWGAVERAFFRGHDPDSVTTNHYGKRVTAKYVEFVRDSHKANAK